MDINLRKVCLTGVDFWTEDSTLSSPVVRFWGEFSGLTVSIQLCDIGSLSESVQSLRY